MKHPGNEVNSSTCAVWDNYITVPETPEGFTVKTIYPGNPDGDKVILNKGDAGYVKADRIHDASYIEDCKLAYVHNKTFSFTAEN